MIMRKRKMICYFSKRERIYIHDSSRFMRYEKYIIYIKNTTATKLDTHYYSKEQH